jgi:hypothetical protein
MYSAVAAPYTILFIATISTATALVCSLLPSISVKFVVFLVCMKFLSELLSIRFLRSLANTTTLAQIVCLHTPQHNNPLVLYILVSHLPELPLFSHERQHRTCQIREQKMMETSLLLR